MYTSLEKKTEIAITTKHESPEYALFAGDVSVKLKENHTDKNAAEFKMSINPAMPLVGAQVGVLCFENGQEWLVIKARPYAALDKHMGMGQIFFCNLDDVQELREGINGKTVVEMTLLPRIQWRVSEVLCK